MIKMKFVVIVCLAVMAIVSCRQNNDSSEPGTKDTLTLKTDTTVSKTKTIVFFGNSITAGYGLDLSQAFPARIQEKIDSMNLPYKVVNAGVSGETSSGGRSRIDWILKQQVDIFVLELGGNDGLRGIPVTETKKNLQAIIDKVKEKNPSAKIIITGMQIPPNMGKKYTTAFRSMYPDLAKQNNISIVPFILEGVGGHAELNQQDGIHPTAEGHRILAANVWSVLKELLE
jgi:acyl-CoA thioesterase-1